MQKALWKSLPQVSAEVLAERTGSSQMPRNANPKKRRATATQSQPQRAAQVKNATRSSQRVNTVKGHGSDTESDSGLEARPLPTKKRRAPDSDSDDEAIVPRKRIRRNRPVARREEEEEEEKQPAPHPPSDVGPVQSGEIPPEGDDRGAAADLPPSGPYAGEIFDDGDEEGPDAVSGSSADDAAEAALMLSEQPIQYGL